MFSKSFGIVQIVIESQLLSRKEEARGSCIPLPALSIHWKRRCCQQVQSAFSAVVWASNMHWEIDSRTGSALAMCRRAPEASMQTPSCGTLAIQESDIARLPSWYPFPSHVFDNGRAVNACPDVGVGTWRTCMPPEGHYGSIGCPWIDYFGQTTVSTCLLPSLLSQPTGTDLCNASRNSVRCSV